MLFERKCKDNHRYFYLINDCHTEIPTQHVMWKDLQVNHLRRNEYHLFQTIVYDIK